MTHRRHFVKLPFHLVIWSVLFEVIGPHIMRVTGDPLDVLAYVVGGVLAGLWWHRPWQRSATMP